MRKDDKKPTHVYIGRKPCGCVVMIRSDTGDKSTGAAVGEAIADGLTVDRVEWLTYADKISKEETFFKCNHGQASLLALVNAAESETK